MIEPPTDKLLAVDEAIPQFQAEKPHLAEIAMLCYYAGLNADKTATVLGMMASTLARVVLRPSLAGPPTGLHPRRGRARRCLSHPVTVSRAYSTRR
jgi:hypothetical protein